MSSRTHGHLYVQPDTWTLYVQLDTWTLYIQLDTWTLYVQLDTWTLYVQPDTVRPAGQTPIQLDTFFLLHP